MSSISDTGVPNCLTGTNTKKAYPRDVVGLWWKIGRGERSEVKQKAGSSRFLLGVSAFAIEPRGAKTGAPAGPNNGGVGSKSRISS